LQRLVPEIAESLEQQVPLASAMVRATCECDGTTVLMSDSSESAEYPQHSNQLPGCGFPIAKLVVIFVAHRSGRRLYCSIAVE